MKTTIDPGCSRQRRARSSAGSPAWAPMQHSWRSRTAQARCAPWRRVDFNSRPFNLATKGHRQPGSAFQTIILARALDDGIDPNSTWTSAPQRIPFQGKKGPEIFEANNYEDSYLGAASLWSATATSDNSVFAQLGMKVKPRRVAALAQRMGIRTKLSTILDAARG